MRIRHLAVMASFCVVFNVTLASAQPAVGPSSVPKIYLERKIVDDLDNSGRIHRKLYFGYSPDYTEEPVRYLGGSLRKAVEPVPAAHRIMQGYLWSGVGSMVGIFGGLILSTGSFIYSCASSKPNADGVYEFKLSPAFPAGFVILGVGLTLNFTRGFALKRAVDKYNVYATRVVM